MVDGVNKTGPIEGQKFSTKGVKLSDLKENEPLFNYFKSKGLDENSYVYESDFKALLEIADKNKNGELSRKEIKKYLGLEGSRRELKQAAKMLNQISETELSGSANGLYPTKVNDNETLYYDKNGTLTAKYSTDGTAKRYEQYENGNPELINHLEESDGQTTTVTDTEFDKEGRPLKRMSQNDKGEVLENREFAYNGDKLASTVDKTGGQKVTTHYNESGQPAKIETEAGGIVTTVENEYNGEKLAKQTVSGAPEQVRAGIKGQVTEYDEKGNPTKASVTNNDGTVDEYNYKDGKPVLNVNKDNLRAGYETKVTNAANPNGTIQGEITKLQRDKDNNITSFTVKSAKSGNEFTYKFDPKTKHFVDQTGTKFYAMKEDGSLERNNKLNKPAQPNLVLKEDAEKQQNQALAKRYDKVDLKTGDEDIKKQQNKQIEADVKAGKVPGFEYDESTKKIKDEDGNEKSIDDVRNYIQTQKDALEAEQDKKAAEAKNEALAKRYAKMDLKTGDDDIKKEQNKQIKADVKAGKIPGFEYDESTKKIKDKDGNEKSIDDVRNHIQAQKDALEAKQDKKSAETKNEALAKRYAKMDLKTGDDDIKKEQNKQIEADVKAGRIPGFEYDADTKKIKDKDGNEKSIDDVRNHIQAQKDAVEAKQEEKADKAKSKAIVAKYRKIDLTTSDEDIKKEQEKMILADVKAGKVPGFKYDETDKKIKKDDGTEVQISDVRAWIRAEKEKYVL